MKKLEDMARRICLLMIRFYQVIISPLYASVCRYETSCSSYTYKMIQVHGVFRGGRLGIKRLMTCHPFHAGIEE